MSRLNAHQQVTALSTFDADLWDFCESHFVKTSRTSVTRLDFTRIIVDDPNQASEDVRTDRLLTKLIVQYYLVDRGRQLSSLDVLCGLLRRFRAFYKEHTGKPCRFSRVTLPDVAAFLEYKPLKYDSATWLLFSLANMRRLAELYGIKAGPRFDADDVVAFIRQGHLPHDDGVSKTVLPSKDQLAHFLNDAWEVFVRDGDLLETLQCNTTFGRFQHSRLPENATIARMRPGATGDDLIGAVRGAALHLIAHLTGMRSSEIASLKIDCLDLTAEEPAVKGFTYKEQEFPLAERWIIPARAQRIVSRLVDLLAPLRAQAAVDTLFGNASTGAGIHTLEQNASRYIERYANLQQGTPRLTLRTGRVNLFSALAMHSSKGMIVANRQAKHRCMRSTRRYALAGDAQKRLARTSIATAGVLVRKIRRENAKQEN